MNRFITFLSGTILFSLASTAAWACPPADGSARAAPDFSRQVAGLDLSDEDAAAVVEILQAQFDARRELTSSHREELELIKADNRAQLSTILNDDQLTELERNLPGSRSHLRGRPPRGDTQARGRGAPRSC